MHAETPPVYPEMTTAVLTDPTLNGVDLPWHAFKVGVMGTTLIDGEKTRAIVMVSKELIADKGSPVEALARPMLIDAFEDFKARGQHAG